MSKRNSGEQKRENSQLKITFSVLIMVLSFLAELYTMIILKGNCLLYTSDAARR